MAGTHEEIRLREPANGTAQMSTIYGEDLKLLTVNIPHPAGDIVGFTVPGIDHGILVSGETCLTRRE